MQIAYWLLLPPLAIMAVVSIILLVCKKFHRAIVFASWTLVLSALLLYTSVRYFQSYSWFFNLENDVKRDHPFISSMKLWDKYPFLTIDCYSYAQPEKEDMDAAYTEIKGFLMSDEGEKEALAAYLPAQDVERLSIDFSSEIGGGGYTSYGASGSDQFAHWSGGN